jgi:hypothetical protein
MPITSEGTAPRNPMKGVTETQETNLSWEKEGTASILHMSHYFTLNVLAERVANNLNTEGWIGGRPCLVTIDTRASVTTARPDITAELKGIGCTFCRQHQGRRSLF